MASESGMRQFQNKYRQLKFLLELWQKGEEACIEGVRKRNESEFVYCNGDDNDGDDKVDDDPTDTVNITAEVKAENYNSSFKHLSPNDFDTSLHDNDHRYNPLKNIKMSKKMKKGGRPKGAEVTVVGLPKEKAKTNDKILPFSKLSPLEKDGAIIEYETEKLKANAALHRLKLIREEDLVPADAIPNTIRDTENINISRVERYFENSAWTPVLKVIEKKEKAKWICLNCLRTVKDDCDSIICERCLKWCHFECTPLKTIPKKKNWFCNPCLSKYSYENFCWNGSLLKKLLFIFHVSDSQYSWYSFARIVAGG